MPGDGLMTRAYAGVKARIADGVSGTLGLSYIDIAGSPVSSTALTVGLARDTSFAFAPGHDAAPRPGRVVRAIKPVVKQFRPQDSLQRTATPLETMTLIGFEASFAASAIARRETFIQATGAVAGDGEGYADFQLGYRWSTAASGPRAFAEVAGGFGGGGDVDTGGGVIGSLGFGAVVPLSERLALEAGVQGTAALDGDFKALSPFLRLGVDLGGSRAPQRWQLSVGASHQEPNSGYRKPGDSRDSAPALVETSFDLFVTDRLYLTGNAQTVALGDAGGYAIGLLGLGNTMDLNPRWDLSVEGHLGAAGGGGVDTGGGLVGAARVELEYWMRDNLALSGGVGVMKAIRGEAQPATLHLGIKTRFSTFP